MKKSIKYAGIAAATLLTVAPIAAPVVSNVTTVQAEDNGDAGSTTGDPQMDQNAITRAVKDFSNQFKDMDAADLLKKMNNSDVYGLGSKNSFNSLADFQSNGTAIMDNGTANTSSKDLTALQSTARDASVYVVATDAKGQVYDGGTNAGTASELTKALKLDSQLPVTFDVYLNYKKLDNNTYTGFQKVASFKANKDDDADLTSVNAKYTTPISVAKNSKTLATQLVSTSNLSVVDQNGDSLATDSISMGNLFYYTYADAINAANGTTGIKDVKTNGDINDKDEFKTAGTYYQTVTYNSSKDSSLSDFIDKYKTDPSSYAIYVNGKKASAGYDFTSAASTDNAGATITFVREIKVSDSESEWTTENVDGQVTTKNDATYYTLKNNDNNTITNRALLANTAWKTDKVRTDQNGNKQYRVATGEWVNADDVTYTKAGDVDTSTDGLTDIQKVTGQVSLDNGNYAYLLYKKDGSQVTNRLLLPGTDWKVINTAKDAQGNTYYRVATNEWLQQGNGVHFN